MLADLGGFDAYWEEQGSGPPLILIHGLGASTAVWDRVAPLLAGELRTIAYDLRGLGRSGTPDPPYSLDDLVRDLLALLDRLGLDRVALVGHSLGGAVALSFAVDHPDRVSRVVVVSVPMRTSDETRRLVHARAAVAEREGMDAVAELHAAAGFPPGFDDEATLARYKRMISSGDPAGYAALVRLVDLDVSDRLPALTRPTLLVAGELDRVVPPSGVRAAADAIEGCEYVELAGCGHVAPLERPDELAAHVLEFVRRSD